MAEVFWWFSWLIFVGRISFQEGTSMAEGVMRVGIVCRYRVVQPRVTRVDMSNRSASLSPVA